MKYIISALTLIILSCGASSTQDNEESTSSTTSSNSKSCLAEIEDPTVWLTAATAEKLINLPEAEIKQTPYKTISIQYTWKSDRKYTMKVGNNEIEVDAKNVISVMIKNLDTEIEKWLAHKYVKQTSMTYEEYFDQFHSNPMTEEAKEEVGKGLDKKAETDEDFDKKSAETAKGLLALAQTEKYTELTGLGDKANYYVQLAPNLRELRLAVLSGNVAILIGADVSDDDDADLAMAKKVLEAVMANCD